MVIEWECFACSKLWPLFGIDWNTLSRYYLTITSDFAKDTKSPDSIFTNIAEKGIVLPGDIGERLAIDEVNLCGQVYTILSNVDISKWIVAILPWTKSKPIIKKLVDELWPRTTPVKEIACDMWPSMEAIVQWVFPEAEHVTDRFHVMKEVLSDLHAIRIKTKTKAKSGEAKKKLEAKSNSTTYNPPRTAIWETEYETIQLFRYQCNKRMKDRNKRQRQRFYAVKNDPLFKELIVGIHCIQDLFKAFDESKNVKEWENNMKKRVATYTEYAKDVTEIKNMISTIQLHHEWIVNYFISWHSTWYSEWLHSRIRELLQTVRWFKNKDFMIYRILKLFSTIPLRF